MMKVPIRNHTSTPLTLFIEPYCDEYEIPPDGEAIVILDDGDAHSLDFHPENFVTLWNEAGGEVVVEVVSKEQKAVVEALGFVRVWLHHYGAEGSAAARDLDDAIEREEKTVGYLRARFNAYEAFRRGFRTKAMEVEPTNASLPTWAERKTLAGAYRAGGVGAYFNYRTRIKPDLVELGAAPFDTDTARRKFDEADALMG